MSLGGRTTRVGAKGGAKEGKQAQVKGKGGDKPQPKEKAKPQATATEQLRIAHMIDRKSEDPSDVRKKVLELMDLTCRSEEEVCSALHDSDNDMVTACYLLLDESHRIQGEWQTQEKKKKKPPVAAAGNGETEPPRDPRSRSGPQPRRGEGEGGRGRGSGRGRGGGRGRGAGRGGRRGAPSSRPPHHYHNNIDDNGPSSDQFPTTEDWDNEEWSGSLSDTKVFTRSTNVQSGMDDPSQSSNIGATEEWDAVIENNGSSEGHIPTYTYHNTNHSHSSMEQQLGVAPNMNAVASAASNDVAPNTLESYVTAHQHQPMGMSGSLSAAQSQYLTQLTQQSQRNEPNIYASNYNAYGATTTTPDISSQRKQRVRVPPPSKIPMSAVEMPPAPGSGECGGATFLDVQFGALEPDTIDQPPPPSKLPTPVMSQTETQVIPAHETTTEGSAYTNTSNLLTESLSAPEPTSINQQTVASEPAIINPTSLDSQLTASMKQLNVGSVEASVAAPVVSAVPVQTNSAAAASASAAAHAAPYYTQHRPKSVNQQNVYSHHGVTHHPPMYGTNVYAPQVNSTNASLTSAAAMTAAYPPSVTLPQFQTNINSYQTSTTASVYGGNALYTAAAPYTAYQHHAANPHKLPPKDTSQYDTSSVPSSNALTSTATTQPATPKVTTTTVSSASAAAGAYTVQAAPQPTAQAQAFYTQQTGGQYAYDDQMIRGTLPHHMGGYYEVGYGARDGTFGLGAGERFGRADAASPQQMTALPAGYAYFYQPPPSNYPYNVYQYGGGGSNVGGVSAASGAKVNTYVAQQQPPYDAQDTYKPAGPYNATGNKAATGAPAAADLTNTMYTKGHVALNKVNSYEKAAFHSGTPPPFGAASHHMYIAPPQHHHPIHHAQPQHQMDVRVNSSHNRRESGSGGARNAAATKPTPSKPNYPQNYWSPN